MLDQRGTDKHCLSAEMAGFEPASRFPDLSLSRAVLSATQPHLHFIIFLQCLHIHTYCIQYSCPQWDLNPHSIMKPDFKSSASTNSAMRTCSLYSFLTACCYIFILTYFVSFCKSWRCERGHIPCQGEI